jgi:hypothetical protein
MRKPPRKPTRGEHHQRGRGGQVVGVADRGEHEVDVRALAADVFGGRHDRIEFAHRRFARLLRAQTREQFGGATARARSRGGRRRAAVGFR